MKPEEIAVDLPAIREARQAASAKAEYWFSLTATEMGRVAALGDSVVLAYAVIRAAAWGPRQYQWVKVSRRASAALNRGYRWWHSATGRLEASGAIEVQRQRGRAPRYRLVPPPPAHAAPGRSAAAAPTSLGYSPPGAQA